jgi:hypothetical protein
LTKEGKWKTITETDTFLSLLAVSYCFHIELKDINEHKKIKIKLLDIIQVPHKTDTGAMALFGMSKIRQVSDSVKWIKL